MRRWILRVLLVVLVAGAATLAAGAFLLRRRPALPPPAEPGRHQVTLLETRRVVPSAGLPDEVRVRASNNNLDVVRHDGQVYLAFRSAPHHFASPETTIYVVRSRDERSWQFEASFSVGTDLREPRLLSLGETLFLYVSKLGADAFAFEPRGISFSERAGDGSWSELTPVGPAGVMGWRVRKAHGEPLMMVYSGGETLYNLQRPALMVEMWRSRDGRRWESYDPEHPVVYAGGGSEADFALGDDGTLYGVIRNEAGDATGWGSKVCRAEPGALARWSCRSDPRKYDSPFMFWHDGEAYLVARRNLNGNGDYDLGRGPGWLVRTLWNQVNYSLTPKRCALWRYVQDEDRFAFLMDLPSRGDTCFPAVIAGEAEGKLVVYDYSCDLDGPDLRWLQGQRGRTSIYRHVLGFERRARPPGRGPPSFEPR